ncbi:MAG: prolyl oligopeptidase family serine peptidase [Myxococcota bacterium]
MAERLAYGSWRSPITAARIAEGGLRLGQPQVDGGRIAWLEGRPRDGGRQVVVSVTDRDDPRDASPDAVNVRSLVHEYGGGDYLLAGGGLWYVDAADGRLHGPGGALGEAGARLADPARSPDGAWMVAVEERAPVRGTSAGEPTNRLRAFCLGDGRSLAFAEGHDFVSFPRFRADGRRLAFTAWEHPDMPWDGTTLYVQDWSPEDGPVGASRAVAGGRGESIFQPSFAPDGTLTYVSDRTGWWNLYQWRDGESVPLCPMEAEFGRPQWVFGMSSYAFIDADTLLCRYGVRCRDRLARLDRTTGRLRDLDLPYTWVEGIQVEGDTAVFMGAAPDRASEVVALDLAHDRPRALRRSSESALPEGFVSRPEEMRFESAGGREVHAFFYPPTHPEASGLEDERPPLLVKGHGGPTAATAPVLDLRIQYWTSRGFAVVDVNYGGSTGYGRSYRERLRGQWGVVDVEDCVAAAQGLAASGRVDAERMAISGGSAGGYTVLCALTFHDVFAAGASHYGIGDLKALARDTHKFESRYTDSLVAPYPEGKAIYEERSPLRHAEGLRCPVIFFQGLEDRVVPPNQAEAMVAALARRGIPHAYVAFPGEQHGFRKAENIRTALDGELYFYSRVFGFEVEERPDAVEIVEGRAK